MTNHDRYAATRIASGAGQLTSATDATADALTDREPELWLEHGILPSAEPAATGRMNAASLIGRAVLRLRLFWGWSQTEVERRSGVDQTSISRLERGVHPGLYIGSAFRVLEALR